MLMLRTVYVMTVFTFALWEMAGNLYVIGSYLAKKVHCYGIHYAM